MLASIMILGGRKGKQEGEHNRVRREKQAIQGETILKYNPLQTDRPMWASDTTRNRKRGQGQIAVAIKDEKKIRA